MMGINGLEALVLGLLAIFVLGPEKLPEYAMGLARIVKALRRFAGGAQEQLREELGDELLDVDWRKLDPRQYDPRSIVREALLEEFSELADAPVGAKEKPLMRTINPTKGSSYEA
ncbi:Sec-independent protein translocase family protein [Arthrobacter sedimenti]|uniref:Sec-independent protein translocase TatB n=1 Tax=Arthrobacter sedimenti TaxID=2694931 RepID=UPI000B5782F2|nr:Sec-independent protein translocase TatB [Arthrobacter sedimenti]OUM45517.1 Sec-independent protein translocase TatB [Arthrobacter agilis]